MTDKFEGLTMSQLVERNAEIQGKYVAVVAELEQVSTESERLKLALSTAMESVTSALHVLRVETARSDRLAVENAVLKDTLECVINPDNEPEYHDQGMGCGVEDHRYQRDGYAACSYGWERAMERIYSEVIPDAMPETPATDAAIAEFLSSKWIAGNISPEFKKYYVRYVTDVGPQFCVAEWYEYDPCVPSDRRIRIWLPDHARSIHGLANVTHYHELPVFNLLTPDCSFAGDKS